MSLGMKAEISDAGEYRVEQRFGCKIIWGSIPLGDLINLTKDADPSVMMSIHLANKIGAAFVFGTKDNLEKMGQDPNLPISQTRLAEGAEARKQGLPEDFANWLVHGHRGKSSDAIAQAVTGVIKGPKLKDHPRDADDLGRCMTVIETLTSGDLSHGDVINAMIGVSEAWTNLVWVWPKLEQAHKDEDWKKCSEIIAEVTK